MSLWIADQAVRKGAFTFGFAEGEVEEEDVDGGRSDAEPYSGLLLNFDEY